MSNDINWNEEDTNDGQESLGNDNGAIKALREKAKADNTQISTLRTQVEELLAKDRERTVVNVLEKKGVNPKAARLVLKDVTEVSEENIDAWLQDNAELFNLGKPAETPEEINDGSSVETDELGRQDALTSQANTPGTAGNIATKINSFKTYEEINAWAMAQQK